MLHAERQLLDGVARILRQAGNKPGWMLLALHLSRIPPPGPRAHHRRVAAAVLEDAAARGNGQLFALANGDMALLFRPSDRGEGASGLITRLFQADTPNPATLRSLWPLPDDGIAALEYVHARVTDGGQAVPAPEPQASAGAIARMDELVQVAPLHELMHRQTAVLLQLGQTPPMTPIYREVAISTAALEARIAAAGQAQADPFLFNHLMAQLDRRMLDTLLTDIPGAGVLSGGLDLAALHVNLSLTGIMSDKFAALAEACRQPIADGLRLAIEVAYVEVFADPKLFVLARERVKLARMRLVLDGVTHHAMLITAPAALKADLLKLNWSPAMVDAGAGLRAAIARVGANRVVLHRAESEAALAWGMGHGIQRFQGYYVDQILAAERLRACGQGQNCTLRRCSVRAASAGSTVRAECANLPLLDLAAPARATA